MYLCQSRLHSENDELNLIAFNTTGEIFANLINEREDRDRRLDKTTNAILDMPTMWIVQQKELVK